MWVSCRYVYYAFMCVCVHVRFVCYMPCESCVLHVLYVYVCYLYYVNVCMSVCVYVCMCVMRVS